MADRFGPIPQPAQNLLRLIEIKQNALIAGVAKIEVGARGTLVSFQGDSPPNVPGLLAYVAKLGETAKLRPDSKLVINRVWGDPMCRGSVVVCSYRKGWRISPNARLSCCAAQTSRIPPVPARATRR